MKRGKINTLCQSFSREISQKKGSFFLLESPKDSETNSVKEMAIALREAMEILHCLERQPISAKSLLLRLLRVPQSLHRVRISCRRKKNTNTDDAGFGICIAQFVFVYVCICVRCFVFVFVSTLAAESTDKLPLAKPPLLVLVKPERCPAGRTTGQHYWQHWQHWTTPLSCRQENCRSCNSFFFFFENIGLTWSRYKNWLSFIIFDMARPGPGLYFHKQEETVIEKHETSGGRGLSPPPTRRQLVQSPAIGRIFELIGQWKYLGKVLQAFWALVSTNHFKIKRLVITE